MTEYDHLSEQEAFFYWLDHLDQQNVPSDLVERLETQEPLSFEPGEIERLEELGKELAGELFDRDAIPELSDMDMDERLLEPEHGQELEHDLDR